MIEMRITLSIGLMGAGPAICRLSASARLTWFEPQDFESSSLIEGVKHGLGDATRGEHSLLAKGTFHCPRRFTPHETQSSQTGKGSMFTGRDRVFPYSSPPNLIGFSHFTDGFLTFLGNYSTINRALTPLLATIAITVPLGAHLKHAVTLYLAFRIADNNLHERTLFCQPTRLIDKAISVRVL